MQGSKLFYSLEDYERITGRPHPEQRPRQICPEPSNRMTITNKIKAVVWDKTEGICYHCRRALKPFKDFQVDHLIPLSKGGPDTIENLVPSCVACNLKKGGRLC